MNMNTTSVSNSAPIEATITLGKDVSAMEIVRKDSSTARSGGISTLPKGSSVEICGSGFNERTYKVRCDDRFFFVFQQDLHHWASRVNMA